MLPVHRAVLIMWQMYGCYIKRDENCTVCFIDTNKCDGAIVYSVQEIKIRPLRFIRDAVWYLLTFFLLCESSNLTEIKDNNLKACWSSSAHG